MLTRRRLLALGAMSAIPFFDASTADAAMGARIDKTLHLTAKGVKVTGTISHWDADELSAVIHVRITQGNQSAHGVSRRYQYGATTWQALASPRLKPGAAVGHAVAVITNQDGSLETYKWTVPVTLVSS